MNAGLVFDQEGAQLFERAVRLSVEARRWRGCKAHARDNAPQAVGACEARARKAEAAVREVALRCEIQLQRAREDRALSGVGGA